MAVGCSTFGNGLGHIGSAARRHADIAALGILRNHGLLGRLQIAVKVIEAQQRDLHAGRAHDAASAARTQPQRQQGRAQTTQSTTPAWRAGARLALNRLRNCYHHRTLLSRGCTAERGLADVRVLVRPPMQEWA